MFVQTEVLDGKKSGDIIVVVSVVQGKAVSRVRITVPKNDKIETLIMQDHKK